MKGPHIPTCRQYLPSTQWKDVIPSTQAPEHLTREWMLEQIKAHFNKVSSQNSIDEKRPLLFLFGRGTASNESNRGWFNKQLKAQSGDLTNDQLWTLFLWILNRWNGLEYEMLFPVLGNGAQFVPYKRVEFVDYAKKANLKVKAKEEDSHE